MTCQLKSSDNYNIKCIIDQIHRCPVSNLEISVLIQGVYVQVLFFVFFGANTTAANNNNNNNIDFFIRIDFKYKMHLIWY